MSIIIADTGPINYLILIGHVEILPALFEKVILPSAVKDELGNRDTPVAVRDWISASPAWVEIRSPTSALDIDLMPGLGPGEAAAITLATELHADVLLMDDRRAVAAALQRGFAVIGTLGLLARAAKNGILDLSEAFGRLKSTNFRYPPEIMDELLKEHEGG